MGGTWRVGNTAWLLLAVGSGLSIWPARAHAQDCKAPCVAYEITAELKDDYLFAADPSYLTANVLEPTLSNDSFFYVTPFENFRLFTSITSEPVIDPEPGKSAAFHNIGTFAGELYAELDAKPFAFRAGKFDTLFSLHSDVAPGIHDSDLSGDLDADERWGAEGAFGFSSADLNHTLAATLFTTDRTFLSESIFTNRGRARLSDGGAGNTEGISSVAVTLDGCNGAETAACYEDGDLGYRLGFRHQRAGHRTQDQIDEGLSPHSEQAYFASGLTRFELGDEVILRLLGETAYVRHFEGDEDDALYFTGSAVLQDHQMLYLATYTQKRNLVAGEPDNLEHLLNFEAIYFSEDDVPIEGSSWELGAAYTFAKDAEQTAHTLSLKATFTYGNSIEFSN